MSVRSVGLPVWWLVLSLSFAAPAAAAPERPSRDRAAPATLDPAAEVNQLEGIAALEALLAKPDLDADTRADVMLRLAEAGFDRGRTLFLREMEAYVRQSDACADQGSGGCGAHRPQEDHTESRAWQQRSVQLYQAIVREHPRYARADQALFFLGSSLADLGRARESADAFAQLVRSYPRSDYAADAYVQLGEHYLEVEHDPARALSAYQKAASWPDHPMAAYASYKLGWCYYNVGAYDEAIRALQRVVETGSQLQLQQEALHDLVRFFADADQEQRAIAYFAHLGRPELTRPLLRALAETLAEQGKDQRAIETYRRLILDDPLAEDAPDAQLAIVAAYARLGLRGDQLAQLERARADYGPGSSWAAGVDPDAVAGARTRLAAELGRAAFEFHAEARELPEAADSYEFAGAAYRAYLEAFPTEPGAYDVHYGYGELLYHLEDFEGAFREYTAVVALDPGGERSKFCAESAMFAARALVDREARRAPAAAGTTEPTPLTEWDQRFVDACLAYARAYPSDDKAVSALYQAAYLLYDHRRFADASAQFHAVVALDPRSNEATLAANLILDTLALHQDWDGLRRTAVEFRDRQGLGDAAFHREMDDIALNASFKQIEAAAEGGGDLGAAADAYVRFSEAFLLDGLGSAASPDASLAARALNNAAAHYTEVGRLADAIRARRQLVEDPRFGPRGEYYYEQLGPLGYAYESTAAFGDAASTYEALWAATPAQVRKPENAARRAELSARAADALYSAAVLRAALGHTDDAVADYLAFVDANPRDARVPDILIRVGQLHAQDGRWQAAARQYRQAFDSPPPGAPPEYATYARLLYGRALEALGETEQRLAIYRQTVARYDAAGATEAETALVAEMMYALAQPALERYRGMEISGAGPGASRAAEDAALVGSLARKAAAQVELERAFSEVVATGAGEWGVASLVALGQVYEDMARALVEGDAPSYLSDEQLALYGSALRDRAYLQQERAAGAYRLALEKGHELNLYDASASVALARLAALRPEDSPAPTERLVEPQFTSATAAAAYPLETGEVTIGR
ncbi:MAG: tetratricopeptide repeat protein [Myxococcota bacterium]